MSYEDAKPSPLDSHNRITKGRFHPSKDKHTHHDPGFPKKSSTIPSDHMKDKKEHVVKDKNHKDLILHCITDAFKRLNLCDHHHDPAAWKLDLTHGDHYRATPGAASSHKRPSGSPDKPSKSSKKRSEKAKSDGNSYDRAEGSGNGREDDDGPSSGHRFPLPRDAPPASLFACPFYKHDPARYRKCMKIRCSRISDVVQHLERCHLLKEITLGVANEQQPIGPQKTRNPEEITLYCPRCRKEFFRASAHRWRNRHTSLRRCTLATIQESGLMLPSEFEGLKVEMAQAAGTDEKWGKIWSRCFPEIELSTPYVETAVPRLLAEQIIERLLSAYPFILIEPSSVPPPILSQSIVAWALNRIFPGSSANTAEFPVERFVPSGLFPQMSITSSQPMGPDYPGTIPYYSQFSHGLDHAEYDGYYQGFWDTQ
ncbi:hypothetical protein F53441_12349 [Fusarium austroafricanum]|uniref:C2H2-type domain-containing protein n=1 Tax=Fusarium austroafricanum TaxID=2364996 RepID=A0A8H4NQF6_9HYPO|nr:hypothetical protein F53441_12349 [Fusarium austroafricanum]